MNNNIKLSASVLKAIGHPIRVQIILALANHGDMTVTELTEHLQIDQPIMSLHLAVLRKFNVILVTKDGKKSVYSILDNSVCQVVSIIYYTRNN
tara:strand:- start:296 stop:577 length:282 start_codon:yes stop_codon:yes gene_type:complete